MRPQDIFILLKIIISREKLFQKQIAHDLQLSPSEVSESLKRSTISGLISGRNQKVKIRTFYEFLIYGLPYIFPAIPGSMVKGIPTAASAPPLNKIFSNDIAYVWPTNNATNVGIAIEPLYPTVPEASKKDMDLYEVLALVDAIRIGHTREKKEAIKLLKIHLKK